MSAFSVGAVVTNGNGRYGVVAVDNGGNNTLVLWNDGTWEVAPKAAQNSGLPVANGALALASSQTIPPGLPNPSAIG
jgi:hypothetical protein